MRRNQGFTLLEAMVALVLVGSLGMTLFAWVNSSIVALRRVEDANNRNEAIANVVEYMQAVNPMQAPEGKADFGNYQIVWKSRPLSDTVDGSAYPQGVSLYQLELFETAIDAAKTDNPHWFEIKIRLAGYKKVRELKLPF
ncbi:prepilin-type N-terminal cleavage/methylation domain-containing protein [Herminiimonas sp. CN]|uniref:type IV pilus modification PilV family protein n=1 Tax=Herminiimonas sp. CN TaxID=1349818 RepID=UPI0004732628|nr:prepilin-type N-terminal cleavage/methylation domain-containing protein [Herminiimonas sp. CN]